VVDPDGGYTTVSGSDAAAAFVAGVAALIRGEFPQLKPEQVVEAITSGAQAADPAAAGQPGYGAGVVNAPDAFTAAKSTADHVPPFDPELAEQLEEEPLIPYWMLWTGGAVLLIVAAVVAMVVAHRRAADP